VVILYAQLGTAEFKKAHDQLTQLADSGKVSTGIATLEVPDIKNGDHRHRKLTKIIAN
jgi:hypothetical protein